MTNDSELTSDSTVNQGPLADLFKEAERQLNICNACRYCEGYCAVFPALERRRQLGTGDLLQLANLCHDCRDCLYACMYAAPHEFELNPPRILSEVRAASWSGRTEAAPVPSARSVRWVAGGTFAVCAGVFLGITAASEGIGRLWSHSSGSETPYSVVPYPALIVSMTLAFLFAVAVTGHAAARFWRTSGSLRELLDLRAWRGAVVEAGHLRYLRGGGAECQYPTETPSRSRRYLHGAVAYGFMLCFVSTIAAAVSQDIFGHLPPYPWLSVPVLTGTVGGIGLVMGSIGLTILKTRSDPAANDDAMFSRDFRLLAALALLGATGLATLLTRTTPAYGVVLTAHLASVATAFILAPYTKFNHAVYRLLALVRDNKERQALERPADLAAADSRHVRL